MDNAQLMKGILEGCVLGIIARGETYGYEILGELARAGFEDLGEGTLYPVLTRLAKRDSSAQGALISCRSAKSPLGPIRKYYSITPEGRARLEDFKKRYINITSSAERILFGGDKGGQDL